METLQRQPNFLFTLDTMQKNRESGIQTAVMWLHLVLIPVDTTSARKSSGLALHYSINGLTISLLLLYNMNNMNENDNALNCNDTSNIDHSDCTYEAIIMMKILS